MGISALVATGVAGWALGRRGLLAESQELQVRYATVPQMEGVNNPFDAAGPAKTPRMRKSQNTDGDEAPVFHTTSVELSG